MSEMKELLKRGMSFRDACITVEAINSCAIEGARKPQTKEDWDRLVEDLKEREK